MGYQAVGMTYLPRQGTLGRLLVVWTGRPGVHGCWGSGTPVDSGGYLPPTQLGIVLFWRVLHNAQNTCPTPPQASTILF